MTDLLALTCIPGQRPTMTEFYQRLHSLDEMLQRNKGM